MFNPKVSRFAVISINLYIIGVWLTHNKYIGCCLNQLGHNQDNPARLSFSPGSTPQSHPPVFKDSLYRHTRRQIVCCHPFQHLFPDWLLILDPGCSVWAPVNCFVFCVSGFPFHWDCFSVWFSKWSSWCCGTLNVDFDGDVCPQFILVEEHCSISYINISFTAAVCVLWSGPVPTSYNNSKFILVKINNYL